MSNHLETEIVAGAIVTYAGEVLLGKKKEVEGHPISGEWHFPGGHIEEGEEPDEAIKREIEEETGLEIEIYQLIDTYKLPNDKLRILYHCEAHSKKGEAKDDLEELRWVEPGDLEEFLEGSREVKDLRQRPRVANLVEKLEKMPKVPR